MMTLWTVSLATENTAAWHYCVWERDGLSLADDLSKHIHQITCIRMASAFHTQTAEFINITFKQQMRRKQRGATYISGNSTGLLLILLWSASMYSSINGHWRTRKKNREGEGEEGDGWVIKIINHTNVTAVAHCPVHWSFWEIIPQWRITAITLIISTHELTHLPIHKTVEGHSHSPHIQSLKKTQLLL